MEKIHLSQIDGDTAAALLVGVAGLDPSGLSTEESMRHTARCGQCYAATSENGSQAVYVVRVENGVAWVDAAKGFGATDWTAALLPIVELQAKGLAAVGFQTARRGLVRRAQQQGYHIAGYIMKKGLQ